MSKIDAILQRLPLLNVFSSKKMIRNRFLNMLGTQPFRVWLAEKRYNIRPNYTDEEIKPYIEQLKKDGIVVIQDFLPEDQFKLLEAECLHALDNLELSRVRQDGPNQYTNIGSAKLGEYKAINELFRNDKIGRLFSAAEKRKIDLSRVTKLLSCLVQGEDNGKKDPETELHEDTFFNTHKAWLYISDVEYPNAPFVYVKGSNNNNNTDRYNKSYKNSIDKNSIHSRRISKDELKELNLEETHFIAKKNTFVLANTLGFHRRLRGEAGNKRIAIAFSARFNPFL